MRAVETHSHRLTPTVRRLSVGEFSETPGGRYRRLGPHSGEQFREEILVPALRRAVEDGTIVDVRIDDVRRSYQSSFLDEAFAGLIRDCGFSKGDLTRHLRITADNARFQKYKSLAEEYIAAAS